MTMREKLIKLICEAIEACECIGHCNNPPCWRVKLAVDSLIANGVEIPVHCCDCASCKVIRDNVGAGHWHCKKMYGFPEVDPTDFCSRGERREGE